MPLSGAVLRPLQAFTKFHFETKAGTASRQDVERSCGSSLEIRVSTSGELWHEPCSCKDVGNARTKRTREMNAQIPIGRVNQRAPAKEETGNIPLPVPFLNGNASQAMASSSGEGEESDARTSPSSHTGCSGCAETVHELANTMTAVLINAQVLEWKLPPYSRMKRPVREIERHAQRGGALLKRLLRHFEAGPEEEANQQLCGQVPCWHGTMAAGTAQGPNATAAGPVKLPPLTRPASAPGSWIPPEKELTLVCDPCTSMFFPKEER